MKREEQANYFHNNGYNCCQAIVAAFSDMTGLTEEQSFAVGGGFGRGLRCGEVCGAISGAIMVLGMVNPYTNHTDRDSRNRIEQLTKEFHRRFQDQFPNMRCRDLLKMDLSTNPSMQTAGPSERVDRCSLFIASAAHIVEQMLEEEEKGTL